MSSTRQCFPARLANLEFSVLPPTGFIAQDLPAEEHDFDVPTTCAPVLVMSSQIAMAVVTVACRPAYGDGSVIDWAKYLAEHAGITLTGMMPGTLRGEHFEHPAILAEGHQTQEGTLFRLRFAMLEDGGRLAMILAMCPHELWPSYGAALEEAVGSFELARPKGPTAPLVPGIPVPQLKTQN